MKQRAVVIGAGYGGLATANLLAKAGYEVSVYDKNPSAGGRISAIEQNGFTFDIGPSWYLMPEVFEQYYQLFGLSAKERLDIVRFSPAYKVYYEDIDPIVIHGNLKQDKQTFEAVQPGLAKVFEQYIQTSTLVYELSLKYFLYNNFHKFRDVFRWPVIRNAPRMIRLMSRNLDSYVSKYFHHQQLKQILEYHMVFLGSSPFQAPAIYTLMSHLDFVSGVHYPRRGMLSLANDMKALGDELGVTYNLGIEVQEILVENGRASGIELADGSRVLADVVISNADIHHTETKLLKREYQSFPQKYWDARQPGPGALLVSLGVHGTLPSLSHHNLFFVEKWRENFRGIYEDKVVPEHASIYVCNPTKTDETLAPKDHENLFFLIPIPAGVTLNGSEQSRLAERSIAAFAAAAKIPDLSERIVEKHLFGPEDFADRYNSWEFNAFGGESHLLKQSIVFRTPNKSRKVKDLYYVGAGTLPGIGLPMCLISAQLTYKQITGNRSAGPLRKEDL